LLVVHDLNTVAYGEALALQRRTVKRLQAGEGDEMLYLLGAAISRITVPGSSSATPSSSSRRVEGISAGM
jgi:hypothetical protein